MQVVEALVSDRSDARLPLEGLLAREYGHAGPEVRMILQIERHLARIVAVEAGEPVLDIGRVPDLGGFPITDNIDSELALPPHNFAHRDVHDALKLRPRVSAAALALEEHVNDGLAAGQTSHVCGQDPLGTQFQAITPHRFGVKTLLVYHAPRTFLAGIQSWTLYTLRGPNHQKS